ncbi:hypothetical protein CHS0354_031339 [Potamilus streckersoni]|uniref:Glycosyl hydrolase family 13 catalytic domain-containing protein n=1 Tax=Potamilus streckersoni TaxID=2493646 RepID=A0AAE0TCG4_9BIVA|nr:hypothetical protein CHS0354_031339 [Potamilus streckersoni]
MSSGVYLLSTKPVDGKSPNVYDNPVFSNGGNADAKAKFSSVDGIDLSLHEKPPSDKPFRGMGKEELLRHSSKPFWRRLRMICISIVILGWIALIITVVALVLVYPRCRRADPVSWWQKSPVYRVYVPSYMDSDGNGWGDLKGLESKLDYISSMGFKVISLSPIYRASNYDFSVTNHTDIDPVFGNMSDFTSLLNTAHSKGMYIVLDFIPNQTGYKHPWFTESNASHDKTNEKRNYYIWESDDSVPNNWLSVYNESAWEKSSDRENFYYLHQFLKSQPDLNLRSSRVQEELVNVLKFWLDMGVDGFFVRQSAYLFEDYDLRNETIDPKVGSSSNTGDYNLFVHNYTFGLPEAKDMLARWRSLLDEYNGTERILIADIKSNINHVMRYYGTGRDGVHLSLNQFFLEINTSCDGNCISEHVNNWMSRLPDGKWSNWIVGDENTKRLTSRVNSTSYIRALSMLMMLLPGTPLWYYGDEVNMIDNSNTTGVESGGRNQLMRGLMYWNNGTSGGFQNCVSNSNCNGTWISPNNGHINNNVQMLNESDGSLITFLRSLTTLRQQPSFEHGYYTRVHSSANVFAFIREFDGEKGYLVAINFASSEVSGDFTGSHDTVQDKGAVEIDSEFIYSSEAEVDPKSLKLKPYNGIVVSWDYKAKEL